LISSAINDHKLLTALVRLIIKIVERGVSGIVDCEGNSGPPVTVVRVVRIHLIDGDEVYQHIYRQERWDKSALTRCAPQPTIHHILASQLRLDLVPKCRNFPVYRDWFYVPLMHSEHVEDHVLFRSLMTSMKEDMAKVGDTVAVDHVENQLGLEKRYVDIIEQFGRYPYRNKVLGGR
jgi:hypothetical protein